MASRNTPAAQIREWAANNGWPEYAGKRGRLPAEVLDAFYKVHTPNGKPKQAVAA